MHDSQLRDAEGRHECETRVFHEEAMQTGDKNQ